MYLITDKTYNSQRRFDLFFILSFKQNLMMRNRGSFCLKKKKEKVEELEKKILLIHVNIKYPI